MIGRNAGLQLAALKSLAAAFPRSLLLYAVCSFLREETGGVLEKLAAEVPLRFIELSPLLERYNARFLKTDSGYYLLPSGLNNDLFFLSLFQPAPGLIPR
jgi:16S rRNA C967 or C1407 C5-methylase (RsmB/RsmF family)